MGQAFQARFSRNCCQVPCAFALIGVAVFTAFGTQILQILYGTCLLDYTYLIGPMAVCTFFTAIIFFLIDIAIVQRNYTGSVVAAAASVVVCFATMTPPL